MFCCMKDPSTTLGMTGEVVNAMLYPAKGGD